MAGAVESALDEPGVTDALAVRLTDTVMSAVDLESILNSVLPPALQRLTPTLVGGATQLVEQRLTDRLADPDTRAALVLVFERAYRAFLDVLEGDGLVDGITVVDGEITVNFLPVVADGLQALQRFGLLDDVTIPELTREGDPSQQIADLEQALGRDLSDDFAQVVVYRSDSLASAGETVDRVQQVLIVVKRSFPLILAVTVIGLVGSVLAGASAPAGDPDPVAVVGGDVRRGSGAREQGARRGALDRPHAGRAGCGRGLDVGARRRIGEGLRRGCRAVPARGI